MKILIAGGAGYIGSHTVREMQEASYDVLVYDNIVEGHREAVAGSMLAVGDIADRSALREIFSTHSVDAVIHFAAYAYVGESVQSPQKYYNNNLCGTINLLDTMLEFGVKNIIFSSTCATYGHPHYIPMDEKHPQKPINPYGWTKFMVEKVLEDYNKAYGLNYIALRYFNAAGAHPDGSIGESHRVETHLIPLVLKTLTGEKEKISVYGNDYNTPDGTCIRDYIHVCDLAVAHRQALERLISSGQSHFINLGTGTGVSVMEIIRACEEISGRKVPFELAGRRPGDPPELVASNEHAAQVLGFKPNYTDIHGIIETAWEWEKNKRF